MMTESTVGAETAIIEGIVQLVFEAINTIRGLDWFGVCAHGRSDGHDHGQHNDMQYVFLYHFNHPVVGLLLTMTWLGA